MTENHSKDIQRLEIVENHKLSSSSDVVSVGDFKGISVWAIAPWRIEIFPKILSFILMLLKSC